MRHPVGQTIAPALALLLGACQGSISNESSGGVVISSLRSSDGLIDAALTMESDWGSGYRAKVTLTSTSATPTKSWSVVIALNGGQMTGCDLDTVTPPPTTSGPVTVSNKSWNASVSLTSTQSFGFNGAGSGRPTIVSVTQTGATTGGGSGGTSGSGGAVGAGGTPGSGGAVGAGGTPGSGGKMAGSGGATGSGGAQGGTGGSTVSSCKTVSGGQSGNFNTTGAFCFRTSDNIQGWGCSNTTGRSIAVNGVVVTCGAMPLPAKVGGYYTFEASAGAMSYASVYWWGSADTGTGGAQTGAGGAQGSGGRSGSGGAQTGSGGRSGSGGAQGSGGRAGSGGASGAGGSSVGTCSGYATRFWDCCKPHCGWSSNVPSGVSPMSSCNSANQSLGGNYGEGSSCGGGGAYMCYGLAPWAVNSNLAYGYAATSSGDVCGRCYQLSFIGSSFNAGNDPGSKALQGKTMIVQAINIGYDVGNGQFDLLVPGGGVGAFNACSSQWGVSSSELGAQYGGFLSACKQQLGYNASLDQYKGCIVQKCTGVFGSRGLTVLEAGCRWFADWFQAADNPALRFKEVPCPAELVNKSGMNRSSRNDINNSCG